MSVTATVTDAERSREDASANWEVRPCRILNIEKPKVNGHPGDELTVIVWDDGTLGVETFTGWYRDPEDEEPLRFLPADTPDVVMALTAFLESI